MPQVVVTKVTEAESHLVVRFDLLSAGVGELIQEVVLSPSDLNPVRLNNKPCFRIQQIWWGLVWFDVTMGFGTLQPKPAWTLTRDGGPHVDFRNFGGISDRRTIPPGDGDGKLWFTTNDFGVANSQGSIVLELRKTNS